MKRKANIGSRMAAAQMHALAAVRSEIHSRDRSSSCKYLREFNDAYRKYERNLAAKELDARLFTASMLLVGDYHALPASQHFAADLLERISQRSRVVLGVEAVLSRDQQILNSWWRREIGEEALGQRLHFDSEWGYDWQPFYSLLTSARDRGEGVYGLDCMPRDDLRSIRSRDRHAAAKVSEIRRQHPGAVILVLFGESHLAPHHLPAALRKLLPEESILTALQNLDVHYWRALGEKAPAIQLSDDTVCVFNASPLEKYESYRLCLEKWNATTHDAPDFAPAIYNLIFSLARSLGFRLDSPHNGTQPRFLRDSLPEVMSGLDETGDSRFEHPGESACSYAGETNTLLVREFNIFAAAREAARFLHYACSGQIGKRSERARLEDRLAHFGARLLCPGIPDDASAENTEGEELYQRYLAGQISRTEIRRMFCRHFDTYTVRRSRRGVESKEQALRGRGIL